MNHSPDTLVRRRLLGLLTLTSAIAACGGGGGGAAPAPPTSPSPPPPAPPPPAPPPPTPPPPALDANRDVARGVADWNDATADALAAAGANADAETLVYPLQAIAAHDALNSVVAVYAGYTDGTAAQPTANPIAALAKASRDVLIAALPGAASLIEERYAAALAALDAGAGRDAGVQIGAAAAARLLALRGSGNQLVSPSAADMFALTSNLQFEVPPPYGTSGSEPDVQLAATRTAAYAVDFNEVKCLGKAASVALAGCTARSADQTEIALFWAENCTTGWNRIARAAAASLDVNGWALARTLALLHMSVTDGLASSNSNKARFNFWRPDEAIVNASQDDNPATEPMSNWLPLRPTPSSPDYPSAHATGGDSARAALVALLGDPVAFEATSTSQPGPIRSYASFEQAAAENAVSRVYIGYHFRHATVQGRSLGRQVGEWITANHLQPV